MKKILRIITILLFIYLLSIGIVTLAATSDSSRGVSTEITFSPYNLSPKEYPPLVVSWRESLLSHKSWLCAQHNTPWPARKDRDVKVRLTIRETDGDKSQYVIKYNIDNTDMTKSQISYRKSGHSTYHSWKNELKFELEDDSHRPKAKLKVEDYPARSRLKDRIANKVYQAGLVTADPNDNQEDRLERIEETELVAKTQTDKGYPPTVYTLGRNFFKNAGRVEAKNETNSALAYVLAEGAYNGNPAEKTPPAESYVNVAFWQALSNPDATSSTMDVSLGLIGANSDAADELYSLQSEIAILKDKLRNSDTKIENLKKKNQKLLEENTDLQNQINQLIANGESATSKKVKALQAEIADNNEEIGKNNSAIANYANLQTQLDTKQGQYEQKLKTLQNSQALQSASKNGTGLWAEAKDFGSMWDKIAKTPHKKYEETILDTTSDSDLKVVFDGNTNSYEVGPLSMTYLEVFTGDTQLCGINSAVTPTLTVRVNGQNRTLNYGNGWELVYKKARPTGFPSKYDMNYPHSGETFYIKINYIQGLERVVNLNFTFRYLQAQGSYTKYEGNGEILKWQATIKYDPHDSGDDYENASVTVKATPLNIYIDTQDGAFNEGAKRWYTNVSKSINWDNSGIDLTTSLGGNVWRDLDSQKTNAGIIGVKDSGEKGIGSIAVTVYLYRANGTRIGTATNHNANGTVKAWPIYTDSDGNWTADRVEVPTTANNEDCFYVVEFKYNGQNYRQTVFLGRSGSVSNDVAREGTVSDYMVHPNSYNNSSMAIERLGTRVSFDRKLGVITGDEGIKSDGTTKGKAISTNRNGSQTADSTETPLYYVSNETENGGINSVLSSSQNASLMVSAQTYYDGTSTDINPNKYRIKYPFKVNGERKWTLLHTTSSGNTNRYIATYMAHINLGLFQRPYVDMSVLKDLYKVTIVVNEQKLTKQFNNLKDANSNYTAAFRYLNEKRTTSSTAKYALGLYNSDLSYQSYTRYKNAIDEVYNIKKDSELRVYVSYVTRVYNNSETNAVEINELKDYYDPAYTLVQQSGGFYNLNDNEKYMWENNQVKTSIVDEKGHRNKEVVVEAPYYRIMTAANNKNNCAWAATREENLSASGIVSSGNLLTWQADTSVNNHNVVKTTAFDTTKLLKNQYIEIFTTYEIDKAGYDAVRAINSGTATSARTPNRIKQLRQALTNPAVKNNIAEISSYSTYYGEGDSSGYYSQFTGYNSERKYGYISGRVDRDSAPNNIPRGNVKNKAKYEDDTDMSIPLNISVVSEEVERTMTGVVWNDKKTENAKYNIKTANGTKDTGESGVPGVEVSMYEVINLGKIANSSGNLTYNATYDSYDYYYKVPNAFYNNGTGAVTTTNNGQYTLKGFLPGDYVLRFDYGKNADTNGVYRYNGQDYENTKFMAGYNATNWLNAKYLDITNKTVHLGDFSVARDNESRRLIVDSYSRTIENARAEILRNRNTTTFKNATRMFAETPIMQVEIRDPKNITQTANSSGNYTEKIEQFAFQTVNSSYTIDGINFGLEQRATTDIELEQFIQRIMLIKQGELVFQAELDESGKVSSSSGENKALSKLTYIPHSQATNEATGLYQQGFYNIEVENEYMNDLELTVKYKIRATNKSQADFTGRLANYNKASDIRNLAIKTPTDYATDALTTDLSKEIGTSSNTTLTDILTSNDQRLKDLISRDEGRIQTAESQSTNKISGADTIRPQVIVYGKYVGRYYYENAIHERVDRNRYKIKNYTGSGTNEYLEDVTVDYASDNIVKTSIDQLINYVDLDAGFAEASLSFDNYWQAVNNERYSNGYHKALNGLISKEGIKDESGNDLNAGTYRKTAQNTYDLLDEKGRAYISDNLSNILISTNESLQMVSGRAEYTTSEIRSDYNSGLVKETVPESYFNEKNPTLVAQDKKLDAEKIRESKYATMNIFLSRAITADTDADNLKIDNLTEVLVYSNTVGKRDKDSVPGNAMKIATRDGAWKAGYNSLEPGKTYNPSWKQPEDDAYAVEYLSIVPPNGISLRNYIASRIIPITVLVIALIALLGIFGYKQIKISKIEKKKDN